MSRVIKWGIIGPGNIAMKFAEGMKSARNSEIWAVASRDIKRAETFAKSFGIKRAYGSYEDIVKDKEIDVIYIAVPHPYHKELSIMCLQHKKAVLCEKPATINVKELEEVIQTAEQNNTFYMEAMWSKFLPVIREIKKIISEGCIGEVKMVKADFCFRVPFDQENRLFNKKLGGGSLLDVGIYPITFACDIFEKKPSSINSFAEIGCTDIDEQGAAILGYDDGKLAVLSFAMSTQTENIGYIYGTDGYIKIPFFWRSRKAVLVNHEEEQHIIEPDFIGNGYNYEIDEVNNCLREGKIQSERMSWNHSKEVMKIMDELRSQWHLVYPTES